MGKKKKKVTGMAIFVAPEYDPTQKSILEFLAAYASDDGFRDDWKKDLLSGKGDVFDTSLKGKAAKQQKGMALGFANYVVNQEYEKRGFDCLATTTPFDEVAILKESLNMVISSIEMDPSNVTIHLNTDSDAPDPKKQKGK